MTTSAGARRWVLMSFTLAAGTTVAARVIEGEEVRPRVLVGAVAGAVMLSLLADGAPKLAAGFATVLAITAFTTNGATVLERLGAALN